MEKYGSKTLSENIPLHFQCENDLGLLTLQEACDGNRLQDWDFLAELWAALVWLVLAHQTQVGVSLDESLHRYEHLQKYRNFKSFFKDIKCKDIVGIFS